MPQGAYHPPEALPVINYLRNNVKCHQGILNERRAEYFKGSSAVKALQLPQFAKVKGAPAVRTEDEAIALLRSLLPHGFFLRVDVAHGHGKPRPLALRPVQTFSADADANYVWLYEGPRWKTYAAGAAILLLCLAGSTFALWPARARNLVSYALYAPIAFYAFVGVLAVLRQILFALTCRVVAPGIWLFPNLHEDCSIIQSFIPLWAWHQPDAAAQKKRKRTRKILAPKQDAIPSDIQFQ